MRSGHQTSSLLPLGFRPVTFLWSRKKALCLLKLLKEEFFCFGLQFGLSSCLCSLKSSIFFIYSFISMSLFLSSGLLFLLCLLFDCRTAVVVCLVGGLIWSGEQWTSARDVFLMTTWITVRPQAAIVLIVEFISQLFLGVRFRARKIKAWLKYRGTLLAWRDIVLGLKSRSRSEAAATDFPIYFARVSVTRIEARPFSRAKPEEAAARRCIAVNSRVGTRRWAGNEAMTLKCTFFYLYFFFQKGKDRLHVKSRDNSHLLWGFCSSVFLCGLTMTPPSSLCGQWRCKKTSPALNGPFISRSL